VDALLGTTGVPEIGRRLRSVAWLSRAVASLWLVKPTSAGGSPAGGTQMSVLSLSGVAAVSVALLCSPASASVVTVIDLGPILNDNISLPNTSDTKTAGKGESFSDYYDFTLPKAEFVSASMSTPGRRWIRFHLVGDI
jgi:hypothetical protein